MRDPQLAAVLTLTGLGFALVAVGIICYIKYVNRQLDRIPHPSSHTSREEAADVAHNISGGQF